MENRRMLLAVDAAINLVLGLLLMLVPRPAIAALGLPVPGTLFYVTVLGAVLCGIAVALWIERDRLGQGLGLLGALAINFLGAGTVLFWLLRGGLDLPLRGAVVLWVVTLAVLATGLAELGTLLRQR